MSVTAQPPQYTYSTMSGVNVQTDSPTKEDHLFLSTVSSEDVSSPDEIGSGSDSSRSTNLLSDSSQQPKIKGILDNKHEALPRKTSRAGQETGFKAALKATFLPPPQPGRQIKVKDGKKLGKSFQRTDERPNDFAGGEVLDYDPRGKNATAGDGILPPGSLKTPPINRGRSGTTESGYGSDRESSLGAPSESGESEVGSEWAASTNGSSDRGRSFVMSKPNRPRGDSIASTTSSSSGAAIKFAPLPMSGRLKRANSFSIGVAARTHLLRSQGTAAPPRPTYTPQHLHGSQMWYASQAQKHEDVVDVGEEIKKGASKAWKLIRGGGSASDKDSGKSEGNASPATSDAERSAAAKAAIFTKPKKEYPKEGAPIADAQTGELKIANAPSHSASNTTPKIPQGEVSEEAKKIDPQMDLGHAGDMTPTRSRSPTAQLHNMSISEDPEAEAAAAALEAAHAKNSSKEAHLPNGHHPHDLQEGPQHNTFHLADEHDAVPLDSGAATPRSGMQRRLSTGAFLRGLSLRGIQEDRRRDILGLDGKEGENGEEGEEAGADGAARKKSGEAHRHGIVVRGVAGQEEELGLEGYGHSRPHD